MNKTYLFALAAALVAVPMAFAHTDGTPTGAPKTYCEDVVGDQLVHDYAPPATGFALPYVQDGSLQPGCPSSGPKSPLHDGHREFGLGGAILVSGWQGDQCGWSEDPDHPEYPTVYVRDTLLGGLGGSASFYVGADAVSHSGDPCGDNEFDYGVECVDFCTVGFPPGLDGTYHVLVAGGWGHVWTNSP